MERFIKASLADLEQLFVTTPDGGTAITDAAYPPGCSPPAGSVRFRPLEVGGLVVEVEPRELDADDFRLAVLFHAGSCVFTDAVDLARFLRGPVAGAFGISAEALPEKPTVELLEDLRPVPTERAPRRRQAPQRSVEDAPTASELAHRLGCDVHGQDDAVRRIAGVVSAHFAKRAPARPESILLIGPSGTGKTSAVTALPTALADLGFSKVHAFRVDCNELTDEADVYRFLGAPPAFVGYTETPPLARALAKPRCIVLLDEIEKAHAAVRTVLLALLDEGRISAPSGEAIEAPGAIVAMTSNLDVEGFSERLEDAPPHDRWRQQVCREHLLDAGWPVELAGRIGAFAVFEALPGDAERSIAVRAIQDLGREYGFEVDTIAPVLVDVVLDLADSAGIGARAFAYGARDLLGQAFATATREGRGGPASLDPGPPPRVVETCESLF